MFFEKSMQRTTFTFARSRLPTYWNIGSSSKGRCGPWKNPWKTPFSRKRAPRARVEVLQKKFKHTLPRAVWAEKSNTALDVNIGPLQKKSWRCPKVPLMGHPAVSRIFKDQNLIRTTSLFLLADWECVVLCSQKWVLLSSVFCFFSFYIHCIECTDHGTFKLWSVDEGSRSLSCHNQYFICITWEVWR